MMKTKLALVIGLAFASCAFGQEQRGYAPSPMPSAASGVRIPMPSDDAVRQGIAAARATGQLSSKQSMDAAAARAKTVADPAALARGVPTGELQDVPMYNQGGKVDPASVAKQYKQMQRNQQSEEDRYNLIVFVSLTMAGRDAAKNCGRHTSGWRSRSSSRSEVWCDAWHVGEVAGGDETTCRDGSKMSRSTLSFFSSSRSRQCQWS